MIGEGGGVETDEKDADVETVTDNDGDAQVYEREGVNSTPGNEGSSGGPMKTMVVVGAGEEGVANSNQTKRVGACSCFPVVRTQEVATQKGMAEEDQRWTSDRPDHYFYRCHRCSSVHCQMR